MAPNHLPSFLFHSGGVTVALVLSAAAMASSFSWRLPVEEVQCLQVCGGVVTPEVRTKQGLTGELCWKLAFGIKTQRREC